MRKEIGDTPPDWGNDADDANDIRDWIAVLEETLRVCGPATETGDTDLTNDLEQALEALRTALGTRDSSNSA